MLNPNGWVWHSAEGPTGTPLCIDFPRWHKVDMRYTKGAKERDIGLQKLLSLWIGMGTHGHTQIYLYIHICSVSQLCGEHILK